MAAAILLLSVVSPSAAFADDGDDPLAPALLQFHKTVTPLPPTALGPDDNATYTFDVDCSGDVVDCVGLTITDTIPVPLVLGPITMAAGSTDPDTPHATIAKSGNSFTITFTNNLGGGNVGMIAGTNTAFTISASVPHDVSADYDGQTITNTAFATVQNRNSSQQSSADVLLAVQTRLAATIDKTFTPATEPSIPGTTGEIGLVAANTSNSSVDSVVVQDPSVVGADAFQYLAATDVTVPTWPSGADLVQVDWSDGSDWHTGDPSSTVSLPSSSVVDPDDIKGLRFTFTSSSGHIAQGASGTVKIATKLRDNVSDLTSAATVHNTASAWLTKGAQNTTPVSDSADLTINHVTITPVATKSFSTNSLVGGKDVGVTIGGSNGGNFTYKTMTLTEPAAGKPNLADQGLGFAGWTQADVEWPVGAASEKIKYLYAGDADYAPEVSTSTRGSVPLPDDGKTVIGFQVVFTGAMLPGEYASLPFTTTTQAVAADETLRNTISVDVVTPDNQTATASAHDDLTLRTARINTTVSKLITPGTIYGLDGASTVVSLPAQVDPEPINPPDSKGSTVGASSLTVNDTQDPANDPFWNNFDLAAISGTDVPLDSTLNVNYWDGSAWVPLEGAADVVGPTSFSLTLSTQQRADVRGVQFVYTPSGASSELIPGFNVQPNLRVNLRQTQRVGGAPVMDPDATDNALFDNTVRSIVASPAAIDSPITDDASAKVTVIPVDSDGTGGLDLISKAWNDDQVDARSGDQTSSTLSWGTGGLGFPSVMVSDTADPETTAIADSAFDAFDLVSIPKITTSMDPLLTFDKVASIELYNGTDWVPVENNPCTGTNCDGKFPGYTLTDDERASTIGVRLEFVESPTRANRIGTNPFAPLVGSGVASSMDLDRHLDLDFQVRDTRRSDGKPVLGTTRGIHYNATNPGFVTNTARVSGRDATDAVLRSDTDGDDIQIVDHPINVTAAKTWDDVAGPLGLPPVGTPQKMYPTAPLVITGTNASLMKVNSLAVAEPSGSSHPFDYVNLLGIDSITVPSGATSSTVTLLPSSAYPDPYTIAQALALTSDDLADATGIVVTHTGRIASTESTVVSLDTQLRATVRSTGDPSTPRTVDNTMTATVVDPGGTAPPTDPAVNNTLTANASAQVSIEAFDYGVIATKGIAADTPATSIAPAIQYDGSSTAPVVTLSARPTGNVRTSRMIIEDSTPTFWNAYNFTGFSSHSFAAPIDRVAVDMLIGVDYDTTTHPGSIITTCDGSTDLSACWVLGTAKTSLSLPAFPSGKTMADIRGLRFTYTKSDYSMWERPYNPLQTVGFKVVRRVDFVAPADRVVPSTLHTFTEPAPGETELATFTNTVKVTADSAQSATDLTPLWTASDDDTKAIKYQHLPAMVKIQKTPVGPLALGADIPYQIVVTNTGSGHDKPLGGVVVTDQLPRDSAGPLLVFPDDPDTSLPEDPSAAFSYSMKQGSTDLPAPTVTANVGAPDADGQLITFTLGGGQTIPLGATLTINATLQFRPLLAAATPVLNTATVTSDQLFDQCDSYTNATTPNDPVTFTDSCTSETTVSPMPSAPLTIVKGVRGVDAGPLDADGNPLLDGSGQPFADLGVLKTVATNPSDCSVPSLTVGSNGYYRYPCVPITRPGADEEWVSRFTNSGNITVTKLVAIDVMPRPGDQGVIIADARGSKWTPTLTEYPQFDGLPENASYTVYYTDQAGIATPRCNGADIQSSMGMTLTSSPPILDTYQSCLNDTGAADDVPNRAWKVLPTDASASVLASVYALKFVVTMGDGMTPGSSLAVTYTSKTAPAAEVAEPDASLDRDSIAYNSIAGAAVGHSTDENGNPIDLAYRFVTEPRKAGVALATGGVRLLKNLTGAGTSFAPTNNKLELSCTSAGEPITLKHSDGTARSPFTVTPGTETLIQGIPLYASCVVTEATDYGQDAKTILPSTVVAQAADSTNYVVLNPHPAFGADGDGHDFRPAVPLSTVTNNYDLAGFTVTKAIDNGGAVNQDGTPIVYKSPTLTAKCTFNNGTGSATVLATQTFPLASGASKSFTGLPAGASCTVKETDAQSAATTTYQVTNGSTVGTATSGTTSTFTLAPNAGATATNTIAFANGYGVGSLTVKKVIAGLGASAYGTGDFTLHVKCTLASATTSPVFETDVTLNSGHLQQTFDNVAAGASCAVTEPETAGATSTTGTGSITIVKGSTVTKTVTNTFDLARLSVKKFVHTAAVDQDGHAVNPAGPFDVSVACTFLGAGNTVLADGFTESPMTFSLDDQETRSLTGLPAGANCTLTETDTDSADSTDIDVTSFSASSSTPGTSASVTLARDTNATTGANSAVINNRYDVSSFTVTKELKGGASAQFGTGPYTIHVVCTAPESVPAYDGDVTLPTVDGAWFQTIENIPTGSVCSAAETNFADSGADAFVLRDTDGAVFDGTDVPVTLAKPGRVTIENWYLTGAVTVTKRTTGSGASDYGTGDFLVSLSCTRDGDDVTIAGGADRTVHAGDSTTFTKLPSGAECVLTEPDNGGASSSTITNPNGDVLAANVSTGYTFTVAVDATSHTDDQVQPALEVRNNFGLASLTVTKQVSSSAKDQDGSDVVYGPFPVSVDCTFEGAAIYADGYSDDTPMTASLTRGESWELHGLAAGASCDVEELNSKSAVDPSITAVIGSAQPEKTDGTVATLVLAPDHNGASANLATIDNPYTSGTISLSKIVTGTGAADWGTQPFTISLQCTLTDASGTRSVWDKSYQVSQGDAPIVLDHVASGADCTVTESKTGGANSTTVAIGVAQPSTGTDATFVTPTDGATLPIVVTNEFDLSSVQVLKVRDGDGAALYGDGPFEVSLSCTRDVDGNDVAIAIPDGATRSLDADGNYEAGYTGLPSGAECAIDETKTGGANHVGFSESTFTTDSGAPGVITVTNTFDEGDVAVTKTIAGLGAGLYGNGPFEVSLACTRSVDGTDVDVVIPDGPTRALTGENGYAASYQHLPADATCVPTETKKGGATTSVFDSGSESVTVQDGGTAAVGLTNTFDLGTIVVNNRVTGSDGKRHHKDAFTVVLTCTMDIDGVITPIAVPGGATRDIYHLGLVTYTDLPIGADCGLVETNTNHADTVMIMWHGVPLPGNTVPVGDAAFQIAVVNVFDVSLAFTGVNLLGVGTTALLLTLIGGVFLIVRRRRLS